MITDRYPTNGLFRLSDLATDTEQTDREAKPAHRQKRLNAVSVFILLILMSYFALTVYSGTLFPLRLVKGTSMEPNLVSGDVVIIKKAAFSSLSVGDVIAYKTPDLARGKVGTPSAVPHVMV